jgi:hypothetical protein
VREQTARFRLLSPFDRTTTLNFFMTQFFFNGTANQVFQRQTPIQVQRHFFNDKLALKGGEFGIHREHPN